MLSRFANASRRYADHLSRSLRVVRPSLVAFAIATVATIAVESHADTFQLVVSPAEARLSGNFARTQLLVAKSDSSGKLDDRSEDLTAKVRYESSNPAVVEVASSGLLLAVGDGQATITVSHDGQSRQVPVTVTGRCRTPRR
jgi:hypothetical protein